MNGDSFYVNCNAATRAFAPPSFVEVSGVIRVTAAPPEPVLPKTFYYWAVQASFLDAKLNAVGWAHLGLQWNGSVKARTAANFGGALPNADRPRLRGSKSVFAVADPTDDVEGQAATRSFPWIVGKPYRLTIRRGDGIHSFKYSWLGLIEDIDDGVTHELRRLYVADAVHVGGIDAISYWSENQLNGDIDNRRPKIVSEWSDLKWTRESGQEVHPTPVHATYGNDTSGVDDSHPNALGNAIEQVEYEPRRTKMGTPLHRTLSGWSI